jgi:Protein of unknown function (DUF4238)
MGHHFVPQRYLRNFECKDRPGFIWIHDKRKSISRQAEIVHVAQTRGYYSQRTEVALARHVEAPANIVIRKLINGETITRAERLQLAFYIGVMLKRVPASRRRSTDMVPVALSQVVTETKEQLRSLAREVKTDPNALANVLTRVDAVERKFRIQPPAEVLDKIREPWPSEQIVRAIFGMTWRILVSSGPKYFVTGDNPAFFFTAFGLVREESELSFPLSTTHTLHGCWQRAKSDLVMIWTEQAIVKEINRRLVSETESLAFYHEQSPWLVRALSQKRPYLSVINWRE